MASPKRKRETPNLYSSPSAPHSPPRKPEHHDSDAAPAHVTDSPRSKVLRQLEVLQIAGEGVPKLDWAKELSRGAQEEKLGQSEGKGDSSQIGAVQREDSQGERSTLDFRLPEPVFTERSGSTALLLPERDRDRDRYPDEGVFLPMSDSQLAKGDHHVRKDHEITGHRRDGPDDDGEGLDGVGFIPTPAVAYARTERRRKQIQEYRSREAREARRLRSERRRGEILEQADAAATIRHEDRRVRFAEAEDC
ncbi:MAG: hypothetical protein M1826_004838 [Phylliscum demangeonii]|nr:MAG: hypothetical protein M1826_004838 [Phylliscum demangeonii]